MVGDDLFDLSLTKTFGAFNTDGAFAFASGTLKIQPAAFLPTLDVSARSLTFTTFHRDFLFASADVAIHLDRFFVELVDLAGPSA